jgi:histidine triad (HIT) family protein
MSKTIFEKIIAREIPGDFLYEDDLCACFRDINPGAPVHLLLVPKRVIPRIAEAQDGDQELLGHLLLTARRVALEQGLGETGFRLVINNGSDGGETVPHLHIHILGGRELDWPPG